MTIRKSVSIVLCVALWLTLVLIYFLRWNFLNSEFPQDRPFHVRVTWTQNPQHEATISWSSLKQSDAYRVLIDTQSQGGGVDKYKIQKGQDASGVYEGAFEPEHENAGLKIFYHHARIKDLKPATNYYFLIQGPAGNSREYYFTTAPFDADQRLKFLAGGDSRTDRVNRVYINNLMSNLISKDKEIIALCHGGDYVHVGTDLDNWMMWLNDNEETVSDDGRILPIIPARGNHEAVGELYNQIFDTPGGDNNYFATHLSSSVLLVTLNTNIKTDGDQQKFLEETLKKNKTVRWQLANYHAPAYPAVKVPSSAKQHFVPLFEKYNTDVVIECDGHVIKRTLPIRNEKHMDDGVIYVGEGGLGVFQRVPDDEHWYLQSPGKCGSGHHVQLFSFSPETLNFKVILLGGEEFDSIDLNPRKR